MKIVDWLTPGVNAASAETAVQCRCGCTARIGVLILIVTTEAQDVRSDVMGCAGIPSPLQHEILGAAVRPPRIAVLTADGGYAFGRVGVGTMAVAAIHGLVADRVDESGGSRAISIGTIPWAAPRVRAGRAWQHVRASGIVHNRVP